MKAHINDIVLYDPDVSDSAKILFYVMMIHADDDGVCRMTTSELSTITGKDVRTVQRRLLELTDKFIEKHNEDQMVFPKIKNDLFNIKNSKRNTKEISLKIDKVSSELPLFLYYWNDIHRSNYVETSEISKLFFDRIEEFSLKELKTASLKRLKAIENDEFWNNPSMASIRNHPKSLLKTKETVDSFLNAHESSNVKPFSYN
jgi:hypothetical protein